jgi:hypothetical protein
VPIHLDQSALSAICGCASDRLSDLAPEWAKRWHFRGTEPSYGRQQAATYNRLDITVYDIGPSKPRVAGSTTPAGRAYPPFGRELPVQSSKFKVAAARGLAASGHDPCSPNSNHSLALQRTSEVLTTRQQARRPTVAWAAANGDRSGRSAFQRCASSSCSRRYPPGVI